MKRIINAAIAEERKKQAEVSGNKLQVMANWVFLDFRRSGVTRLAGAGFPPHVADRLLNHVQGTIRSVAAIYQRNEFLPERKAALDAWAAHLLECGEGEAAPAKVASIAVKRRRRTVTK